MNEAVISIDTEKCIGCGKCVSACSEGAIRMVNGKATLVNGNCCDGLGACLPACPANALTIVKRAITESDGVSVTAGLGIPMAPTGGMDKRIDNNNGEYGNLSQWPIQLRLISPNSSVFKECDLLIAADCTAFSNKNFHENYIKGRKIIIGCPKLDPRDCWDKLTALIANNEIKSITITRMDVPCCSGIVSRVSEALKNCGKNVPVKTITIHSDGKTVDS